MWKCLALFLVVSCSLSFGPDQPKSAKSKYYQLKFKDPNWNLIKEDKSDYVFINKNDGRIMLSNSFCDAFQDQPLDQLARRTLKLVDDLKISKEDYETFNNREAYRTSGNGKVDGVPVGLNLLNTRRNNCYFDFVSITPLNKAKDSQADFDSFLKSVEFK